MGMTQAFVGELENEAPATRRLLERVPGDKLDYRPHPKALSLGQLARHVATIPGAVAGLVKEDTVEVTPDAFKFEGLEDASALPSMLDESVAGATEYLANLDDAGAMATWRAVSGDQEFMALPRAAAIRTIMLNHWYHHRGQLCTYLRTLDVELPAVYGPSADENPFA